VDELEEDDEVEDNVFVVVDVLVDVLVMLSVSLDVVFCIFVVVVGLGSKSLVEAGN